jgi:hypothetical protein
LREAPMDGFTALLERLRHPQGPERDGLCPLVDNAADVAKTGWLMPPIDTAP